MKTESSSYWGCVFFVSVVDEREAVNPTCPVLGRVIGDYNRDGLGVDETFLADCELAKLLIVGARGWAAEFGLAARTMSRRRPRV